MSSSTAEDANRKKKRKKKRGSSRTRVHPEGSSGDVTFARNGYMDGMNGVNRTQDNNSEGSGNVSTAADAFNIFRNVKKGAEQFKGLRCSRRVGGSEYKTNETPAGHCIVNKGKGIHDSVAAESLQRNRFNEALISYFARLARSDEDEEEEVVDLEYVEHLLDNGANIRCTDKHGQTVLHEAVRAWQTDVALFLLQKGANVNQQDQFGRAPLHIAAAVDYPEMINLLLDNDHENADIEILTEGENQTPLHFAARNDASEALKTLHKLGANLHARDHKGRTPLQVAAELDRSETAKLLLELGANASDIDNAGQTALVQLICKMPAVAKEALDQFHRCDRANRKQYYDHHLVEPTKPGVKESGSRSALQVIVQFHQLELILHPVIQRLLEVKWKRFGCLGACWQVLINLAFILLWSVIAVTLRPNERLQFPADIWRLAIWALGILITIFMVFLELQEIYRSKKKFRRWRKWRVGEIKKDLKFCHPQWPQEEVYLQQQIKEINEMAPAYFREFWNLFDWLVYCLLLVITGMFIASQIAPDDNTHEKLIAAVRRIMAVSIIPIWLRFMKAARAFKQIGPFIVMLGHIVNDLLKFGFLYLEFYIPYACAFWMIFGNTDALPSMKTVDSLLFTLFRMTLVDEYNYDKMHEIDAVMAYILVATFLFLSALLCVNLFIALLSDTFQRVYDNATSNAAMQQASIILGIEESLSKKRIQKYRCFIHTQACPESLYYDDDQTEGGDSDLKKVTFQIKDSLEELKEQLTASHPALLADHDHDGRHTPAPDRPTIQEELSAFRAKQERANRQVQRQLKTISEVLQALLAAHSGGPPGNAPNPQDRDGINRPGLLVTHPSIPHDSIGIMSTLGVSDEDDYEMFRRPRFVGRHLSHQQSTTMFGSRPSIQSPRNSPLATQRSFLDPTPPQPVTATGTTEMDVVDKERLKIFREEQKRKLKQRREQEDYLLQQQKQGEVAIPMSEVTGSGEVNRGHDLSDHKQVNGETEEPAELVKFSPTDKDVEKQEVSDKNSTDA